jgi:hypothetical protein
MQGYSGSLHPQNSSRQPELLRSRCAVKATAAPGVRYLIRTLRGRHVVFSWLWRGFQFGDTLGQEHDDSVLTAGFLFPALDLLSRYISRATPVHQ